MLSSIRTWEECTLTKTKKPLLSHVTWMAAQGPRGAACMPRAVQPGGKAMEATRDGALGPLPLCSRSAWLILPTWIPASVPWTKASDSNCGNGVGSGCAVEDAKGAKLRNESKPAIMALSTNKTRADLRD